MCVCMGSSATRKELQHLLFFYSPHYYPELQNYPESEIVHNHMLVYCDLT